MKSYEVRQQYFDKCRAEAERIMKKFDIVPPRCGFNIGLGWMPAVENAFERAVAAGWDKDLQQVKQKFCGLRIYTGGNNSTIQAIFDEAEVICSKVCEVCGRETEDKGSRCGWALCNTCKASDGKGF